MLIENMQEVTFDQFWPKSRKIIQKPNDGIDITIVTAFFDIKRSSWGKGTSPINKRHVRTNDDYLKYFSYLARIKNQMIIFIDENLADQVLSIRRKCNLHGNTIILTHQNFFEEKAISKIIARIECNMTEDLYRFVWNPFSPKFHSAKYVALNSLKSCFVNRAINLKSVSSSQVAWIDFGYCRSNADLNKNKEWKFNAGNKINLFQIKKLDESPIFNIVKKLNIYFNGGHIIGSIQNWSKLERDIDKSFSSLISCGFVDDDQLLLLMAYRENPKNFILHPIDANNVRIVFKHFNSHSKAPNIKLAGYKKSKSPIWVKEMKLAYRRQKYKLKESFKNYYKKDVGIYDK
jgi:protein YibB